MKKPKLQEMEVLKMFFRQNVNTYTNETGFSSLEWIATDSSENKSHHSSQEEADSV